MESEKRHREYNHDHGLVERLARNRWRLVPGGQDAVGLDPNGMHRTKRFTANIESLIDKTGHTFFQERCTLANLADAACD
jgi:hypothetical protein